MNTQESNFKGYAKHKERVFTVRLDEEQRAFLTDKAKKTGLSKASLIRATLDGITIRPKNDKITQAVLKERPGVAQDIADRVYDRLVDRGYIDDEKFTRYWLENRSAVKGVSRRKLIAELRGKGVEQRIIDALLPYSARHDTEEVDKIIAKKRSKYPDEQKFKQYLMRQGFSYDLIQSKLNGSQDQASETD